MPRASTLIDDCANRTDWGGKNGGGGDDIGLEELELNREGTEEIGKGGTGVNRRGGMTWGAANRHGSRLVSINTTSTQIVC
mmetsp:Transcript_18681/g.44866  ORF Transcript_18681/g.44866 Transcript_18681/m.44866 type:complete len:81 (+) Transcript_18681:1401-1643(+)|eukprot:2624940-Rhodomonas_salina.1